ncbi:hypothetical protein ACFLVW_07290 [Chloroflexota bacterium]
MKGSLEFSDKYVQMMADYFEVPPEDIMVRIQKPWGITNLERGATQQQAIQNTK